MPDFGGQASDLPSAGLAEARPGFGQEGPDDVLSKLSMHWVWVRRHAHEVPSRGECALLPPPPPPTI